MNKSSILFDDQIIPDQDKNGDSKTSSECFPNWTRQNQTNSAGGPARDLYNASSGDSKVFYLKNHKKRGVNPENISFRSSDYKIFSNMFIGSIMAQYILTFFAIPFSEVDNRPAASVLSCLVGYLSFVLCILMIPAGLINVPTKLSLQSSFISCLLKFVDLAANIYSLILCLRVKEPMIEYTYDQDRLPVSPLDITVYVQVVSILLLIMSVISLIFAIVVFLFNLDYYRAKNRSEKQAKDRSSTLVAVVV